MAKTTKKAKKKVAKASSATARASARKKPAKAARASKTRATARPPSATKASARKKAAKAPKKGAKKAARKAARTPAEVARKAAKASRKATPATAKRARKATAAAAATRRAPTLDRERRTVPGEEPHGVPSSLDLDRTASSIRTGRAEYAERLRNHTSTGPAMTGGDVDADWEDAETVGDEAPGGDNPTPDQDVVEEIGRALGIEYQDNQELQGGDELAERDKHRWELDPASREDYDDEE